MNINEMEAGRELDALVAEKVMGWHRTDRHFGQLGELWWNVPDGVLSWAKTCFGSFQPSTDIAAAWQVVERVNDPYWRKWTEHLPPHTQFMHLFEKANLWQCSAQRAALLICHAALLAVGVKEIIRETIPST